MDSDHNELQIINITESWIRNVVIECHFCPFAAKPINERKVYFSVHTSGSMEKALEAVIRECYRLDENEDIETSLLILPDGFADFDRFLELLEMAEDLMEDQEYEGIYQLASFHPAYLFAGSDENDAANYTNRSPYPMLHFLREESVEKALKYYKNPDEIPENNMKFTREKGLLFMQSLFNMAKRKME